MEHALTQRGQVPVTAAARGFDCLTVGVRVLSPPAFAFDAVAPTFDERFGSWRSVDAQRRAVRRTLAEVFPPGARILEIGGGTGEDALWLAERGCGVVVTDASPRMVQIAARKLGAYDNARALVAGAETLATLATLATLDTLLSAGAGCESPAFDGAFSNFAALNCVHDLSTVARGLARHVRANGVVILVLFGTCSPGEIVVELVRSRPRSVFRRFSRGAVPARLGGRVFTVRYHRAREITRAMNPWFRTVRKRGIGILVPPSAAEPWISAHPKLLHGMEAMDRVLSDRLAVLGDHVLYQFERTPVPWDCP